MQDSPQIYEMLNNLREEELRRIHPHRIEAITSRASSDGVRATIAGAIVRVGLLLDSHAAVRETDRRDTSAASPRLSAIVAPEGDPACHW